MKQILVISGKGGTGKTVISGALACLAENKIMADCDVDAADLHLLLSPLIREKYEFKSGKTAVLDRQKCLECGRCRSVCRFEAITPVYRIISFSCEGCGLCSHICPNEAIHMKENIAGEWFVSETRFGSFIHAKLGIGEENSGKLVAKVRQVAKEMADKTGASYVIIDGPPGTGCPVLASLSGVDCVLLVTEPTLSGLHDAQRVMELASHFQISVKMVVNKYDLNPEISFQIENFCQDKRVEVIGRIPFDKSVVEAMVAGKTIPEYLNGPVKEELVKIWNGVK